MRSDASFLFGNGLCSISETQAVTGRPNRYHKTSQNTQRGATKVHNRAQPALGSITSPWEARSAQS